jgi:hypothetical protein
MLHPLAQRATHFIFERQVDLDGRPPLLSREEDPGFHPGELSFVPKGLDPMPEPTQDYVLGYFLPSVPDWVPLPSGRPLR